MRYIEMNPVRATNMAKHPKDYHWSSYGYNALGKKNNLITPHRVYKSLGTSEENRQGIYRYLFKNHLSERELSDIRDCTNRGWVLGSEQFKEKVEKLTSRRAKPKPKGRPKKVESRV
jgi:REP-associated tyrosine transposase